MKTDKEYPATHSMCTAGYFVDEEDNVAIFSFDDNGPIPDTVDQDIWVNELCFITGMTTYFRFIQKRRKNF